MTCGVQEKGRGDLEPQVLLGLVQEGTGFPFLHRESTKKGKYLERSCQCSRGQQGSSEGCFDADEVAGNCHRRVLFCFGLVVYLTHSSFLDTCLETSALQSPSLLITSSILPSCGDVLSTPICRERDRKLWDLSSGGQRAELGFDTGLKIPSPRLTHCIATISGLIPESAGSSRLSVCLLSASLRVKPHEEW